MPRAQRKTRRQESHRRRTPPGSTAGRSSTLLTAAAILACLVAGIVAGISIRERLSGSVVATDTRVTPREGAKQDFRRGNPISTSPAAVPASETWNETVSADTHQRRQAEQRFGQLFRLGYNAYHEQRYSDALAHLQQAVDVAPHLAEGHYYLGLTYAQLMMSQRAEQQYRAALDCMHDFSPAEEQLCILLYERGAYDEATTRLQEMLHRNPKNTFALGELAMNRLAQGDTVETLKLLEEYNRLKGPDAWGIAQQGRALDLHGDPEAAEEMYREALELDPHYAVVHHWLGLSQSRRGQNEAAQKSFAEYGRLRSLLNREHQMKMALLRQPNDLNVLIELTKIRLQLGHRSSADATLKRAEQMSPNHLEVRALRRSIGAAP